MCFVYKKFLAHNDIKEKPANKKKNKKKKQAILIL